MEKAFDSLDHDLALEVIFVSWIKLLQNGQQSCIINGVS